MSDQDPLEANAELVAGDTLERILRSEIDVQIATAHKFPRSMSKFKERAIAMATMDEETAASCIYCRPVGKEWNAKTQKEEQKYAEGMSVRMAEIVGASYGNLRVGAMLVEQTDRQVKARGYAHDLESNFASGSEFVESTVNKKGQPYPERMRAVTAKACLAKARRDATFQVVPRAICKPIEAAARKVAIGDEKSLASRRAAVVQWLGKLHIDITRVWNALQVQGPDDLTLEHLTTLTGLRTAIKDNDITIDDAFPLPTAPDSKPKNAPTFEPYAGEIPMGATKPVAVASAQAAPPAQSQPEAEVPAADPAPESTAPVATTLQAGLCDVLEGAGVSFEDFRDWLGGSGKVKDATALTGWMDIPDKVCVALQKSPKELAAVVKLYGRKEDVA